MITPQACTSLQTMAESVAAGLPHCATHTGQQAACLLDLYPRGTYCPLQAVISSSGKGEQCCCPCARHEIMWENDDGIWLHTYSTAVRHEKEPSPSPSLPDRLTIREKCPRRPSNRRLEEGALWSRDKTLAPAGNQTTISGRLAHSLANVLITLCSSTFVHVAPIKYVRRQKQ